MMNMFKSLKFQLLFYFLMANTLILLCFSLILYSTAQKGVSDTLNSKLKLLSSDVIQDIRGQKKVNAKQIADELVMEFGLSPLFVKIIHYNKQSKRVEKTALSEPQQAPLFHIPLNEIGHPLSIYYFDKDHYRISSMLIFEEDDTKVFLQLATTKQNNSHYLEKLVTVLFIANPILLLLFLLIGNVLINKTLSPVKKVIGSVHSLSPHTLSERIQINEIPNELKELVQTFNDLLGNIEEAFERISTFSNDASHELKTPLTVILGEAEVGLRKERTPAEYKVILQNVIEETVHVKETIDQLFLLTKKDTSELTSDFQELYLDEVITDVVLQHKRFAEKHSVKIILLEVIPCTIYANEGLLKISLNNLLRNAIIYSKEGSEVHITMREENTKCILKIEDKGCGIAEEDLPFIFERFFRVDKARARKDGGTGLGLAIVKMILDLHGFDIQVKSILGQGTTVVVTLPKL